MKMRSVLLVVGLGLAFGGGTVQAVEDPIPTDVTIVHSQFIQQASDAAGNPYAIFEVTYSDGSKELVAYPGLYT